MYLYRQRLSLVFEYMQFYHQCVQQKTVTKHRILLKEVSFCSLSHSNTEKELPKIAYIPEKEYNYSSIHYFDTSHFFVR